jgi:hypothetical protein
MTVLVALTLLAGACGDDSESGGGTESGSSYDTVTALNNDLAAADISCELEYEGLEDADRDRADVPRQAGGEGCRHGEQHQQPGPERWLDATPAFAGPQGQHGQPRAGQCEGDQ